jgi:nitrate reductase (NAD(P)H)
MRSDANANPDSETAKAMMPDYHIGSLDAASRTALAEGEPVNESSSPRPIFLDSRIWNKALLHAKTPVSWDTRIFTFKLDHEDQELGLPTGQHLMIRLRDPVTREAIIRSYTPISQTTKRGFVDVLIKIYADSDEKVGGKMTKALDAIPVGHFVDFKGPIGKFTYLGGGRCDINGKEKRVKKFYMVCGGSGITPIYQVLRAVMQDKDDPTHCTVLNGNRLIEDILCREDLDTFAAENPERCTLLNTLTKGPDDWTGLRGRIGPRLLEEHCTRKQDGGSLVLICGPEALEKSTHVALKEQGWSDDELMFF